MPSLVPTVRGTTFYQTDSCKQKQEEILDLDGSLILTPQVWPTHCPWWELERRPVPAWYVRPVDVQHWPLWWRSCHTCYVVLSPRQPFHCCWPENNKPYFNPELNLTLKDQEHVNLSLVQDIGTVSDYILNWPLFANWR